ncbi:penicillin-binding protein 1C [Candidatus Curtissbacteria bacterium]|nr:penicillin-binding protein 1C [Candidatus Curtissbacteria bacterium]
MAKRDYFSTVIGFFFSIIVGFLTWFIRLVTFFGDITIWILRHFFISLYFVLKRLNLDLKKRAPRISSKISSLIHHPIVHQDKSFKFGLVTIAFIIIGIWYFTKDLPSPRALEERQVPQTTKIYDRNGKLLYNVYTDENRTIVPLSEVPDTLEKATIAIEDKDFYKHKGFDIYGIIRAAESTVFKGNLQGGSTITQQLVKSAFLTPERTINRKVKELYLAFRVEMAFSKNEILEMYLNQVPYGGTAWGASAAAEQYFGKKVEDLSLGEAALLAGLPQAPSYFSPFSGNPQRAKDRQLAVLRRMVEDGYISQEEANAGAGEELKFKSAATDIKAPHFVMYVREYLAGKYGETVAAQGGLKVTTTIDLDLQEKSESIVRENIEKLKPLRVGNGAALVTKPKSGEILAMVGSRDFFNVDEDGNVNVTVAQRQPGSSIKPINYGLALDRKLITPATIIIDVATTFSGGPSPYRPVNYDGKYHGPVTVRNALGNSYNIPAVKVLALNGVDEMVKKASEMGINSLTDPSRYGLSLTLGGGEVKMTEMATAFGVFANQGERIDLVPVLKVEDSRGKILEEFKQKSGKRVLSTEASFLISSILSDNGARSSAFGPASLLNIKGKTVAVKTGTTDDKRDNWTIGYTPSYLVATWVGNNDNTPMHPSLSSGVTGAAPIWNAVMAEVLRDKVNEAFKVPSGVVAREVCSTTGGAKSEKCSNRTEYFIAGTEPKKDSFAKAKVWIDKTTGQVVEPGSPNAEEQEQIVVQDPYSKKDFCASCPQLFPSPSPSPSSPPLPQGGLPNEIKIENSNKNEQKQEKNDN